MSPVFWEDRRGAVGEPGQALGVLPEAAQVDPLSAFSAWVQEGPRPAEQPLHVLARRAW
jgi:hypothetical protein